MERLLAFLKSQSHHLLFIALEVVALVLLFSQNRYNKSVILSTANRISGEVTELTHTISAYKGLSEENIQLLQLNASLQREVQTLRYQLQRQQVDTLSWQLLSGGEGARAFPYDYVASKVVGNTLFSKSNSITIDIGEKEGIRPDMAVVSSEGVVGVVVATSQRYALVLPLINEKSYLSCMVGGSEHVGTLNWDGVSHEYSLLTNLPRHAKYQEGDSVFTSGYSSIFPDHIFVGTIAEEAVSSNDSFIAVRVKLATTFSTLKYVYVLRNHEQSEQDALEATHSVR
ncbi:MAG: rod shape-determining protein MreC [Porphyromonas sp.]|nr:rod shape-determining protein MreC [Porphyromonas sp.]